jgi:CheY-like chemotaxis protein
MRKLLSARFEILGLSTPFSGCATGWKRWITFCRSRTDSRSRSAVAFRLLLDLGLPGVSGFQILKYLQTRPAFAATLKLVISQLGDINSIKQAYALGAQSFLTKPINQTELRELITSFPSHWLLDAGGRAKRSFASS